MPFIKQYLGVLALLVSLQTLVQSTLLPKPGGKYKIGTKTMDFEDVDRLDPFAPKPETRRIMTSAFFPVAVDEDCFPMHNVQYMPGNTAKEEDRIFTKLGVPGKSFEKLELSVCRDGAIVDSSKHVLLFSPDLGVSRLIYTAIAAEVASAGYIVILLDHPYDADLVEFSKKDRVWGTEIRNEEEIELALATRADDATFVLDHLGEAMWTSILFPGIEDPLGLQNVGMFGHGLGGAAAALAVQNDSRIVAGINLDGAFPRSAQNLKLDKPFLLFGHDGHNHHDVPSWATFYKNLRTKEKFDLKLLKAEQYTFTDLPLVVDTLNLEKKLRPEANKGLEAVNGKRALKILRVYIDAFFGFTLSNITTDVFVKEDARFPEVRIVR